MGIRRRKSSLRASPFCTSRRRYFACLAILLLFAWGRPPGSSGSFRLGSPTLNVSKRINKRTQWCAPIILHTVFGLNNRLRAYASVSAFARANMCPFTMIWPVDESCKTEFKSLFEQPKLVLAVYKTKLDVMHDLGSDETWLLYDYTFPTSKRMLDIAVERPVYLDTVIYIRSHVLVPFHRPIPSLAIAAEIKELVPVLAISELVETFKRRWGAHIRSAIGIQIRMNGNFTSDIPDIPPVLLGRLQNTSLTASRQNCHVTSFIQSIKKSGLSTAGRLIIVASDSAEAIDTLMHAFSTSMIVPVDSNLSNSCNSGADKRGHDCTLYCFAEQMILAETQHFFYSSASSVSENILRLRAKPLKENLRLPWEGYNRSDTHGCRI